MAGINKGGHQHFTVQEAQNATLGQVGSMFQDSSGAMSPGTDKVFVAITFITDTIFNASGGLVSVDEHLFINTEAASNAGSTDDLGKRGSGGIEIDDGNIFPAGLTIYGRWTSAKLVSGSVIAYVGN